MCPARYPHTVPGELRALSFFLSRTLKLTHALARGATRAWQGYTLFEIGNITNALQIKNTIWHQFGNSDASSNQTRFKDLGTSNRLSDAFESSVAGPSALALCGGAEREDDVALPYLRGYGPSCAFTEETGTLFGFAAPRNCTLGGLRGGLRGRRLVLVNEGDAFLTISPEAIPPSPFPPSESPQSPQHSGSTVRAPRCLRRSRRWKRKMGAHLARLAPN